MQDKRPTVIICPGGAYAWRSPREGMPVAREFEKAGFRTRVLEYDVREKPEDPPLGLRPVSQLSSAVGTARRESGGAPVLVCGFSAGGHLAATLGVHWKQMNLERPDALILGYPVITAHPPFCHEMSVNNLCGENERDKFSLEKQVTGDVPPVFLWHTAADESVPVENSLLFAGALSRAKVPFELHIYPYGGHGLSLATEEVAEPEKNRFPDPHVAGWMDACVRWSAVMFPDAGIREPG